MKSTFAAIVLAFTCAAGAGAQAQAISVEIDANTPAYSGPQDADHEQYATDAAFSMRIGWLSRAYAPDGRGHRWSLFVGRQAHDTIWQTASPYEARSSATTIELGHDWRVVGLPQLVVSAGAACGLILVDDNSGYSSSCDSPFCNMPDGGWQISGYGRCEVPLSPKIGLVLGVRGRLEGPRREDLFPFAAGPVVSVGVLFSPGER